MCASIAVSLTACTAPPLARAAPSARSPCDGLPTESDGTSVDASTREMPRSAANASAIGLEPSDCPAISLGTGSRESPDRVSSENPCASFASRVPLAAGQTTASGSSQPSCSAISNEIVLAPSLAYGWRLPLTKPHGKSAPSSSSRRRQSS